MPRDANTFKIKLHEQPQGIDGLTDIMRLCGTALVSKTDTLGTYEIYVVNRSPGYMEKLEADIKPYGIILDISGVDSMCEI